MSLFNYHKTYKDCNGNIQTKLQLNEVKVVIHSIIGFILGILALILVFGSWTIIQAGERGVILRFGNVDRVLEPGFHLKIPFAEKVVDMEVRTQKIEVEASAASKDLQIVTTNLAIQFNLIPDMIGTLYEELKTSYRSRVIDPAMQDAIKASTAQFNAEELIKQRPKVKIAIEDILRERLAEKYINVTNVDIVNFEFSSEFNQAIERKVKAEQQAFEQENITKQEEEKKKQEILKAEAIAIKTKLEVQALAAGSALIEKIKAEAQLEAAKRWNGVLPTHLYGSAPIPLLNLTQ